MSKEDNIMSVRLTSARSLIYSNLAPTLNLEGIQKAMVENTAITSLGLWNVTQPNLATYYPDVKPEDLAPKEEDFAYPLFRALSETIVHKSWNPVSFKKPGVLKKSMSLLVGQTIYTNHDMIVGNELGVVRDAAWHESYSTADGDIPAGINTRLMVDGKKVPGIVRSIQMEPPAIHSVSVTVSFRWEQSHPKLSSDEFYRKMGTYDEKGELIHRVASEIIGYSEISFVPHGADSFAKKIGPDGKIVKSKEAIDRSKLSDSSLSIHHLNYTEIKNWDKPLGLEFTPIKDNTKSNTLGMNREQMLMMAFMLSIDVEKYSEDAELAGAIKTATKKLSDDHKTLQTEVGSLKAKQVSEEDLKLVELGKTYRAKLEADFKKNNTLLNLEADNVGLDKLSSETLEQKLEAQKTSLNEKLPLSCKACGSKEVTRQATKTTKEAADNSQKVNLSADDALSKLDLVASQETLKNSIFND